MNDIRPPAKTQGPPVNRTTSFELPTPPDGVSKKALSTGYVIAVSVSMVLALNGIIQFFGGNAFTLKQSEQKSAFTVVDKLLDQNAKLLEQNGIIMEDAIERMKEFEKKINQKFTK